MAFDVGDAVKRAFTENLNLKVLSFGFALVLYSLVHGQNDAQRVMFAELVRVPPPETRVLTSQIPPRVRVTLRGPRSVLEDLRADDLGSVQIDLHTGTERRVTLEPKMVHVPPGVRVEQIDPPALDFTWEDLVVRDVPVQVSVVGTPATGFVVKGVPVATPATVRAHGPKSEVLVLQHVRVDALDVSGLSGGAYTRNLALDKPTGSVAYSPTTVSVAAEIAREIVERNFSKVAVVIVGLPKAKSLPAEVDVRMRCPPDVVLRPEQIVPHAEVTSKDPTGSVSVPVTVSVGACEALVTPENVVVKW